MKVLYLGGLYIWELFSFSVSPYTLLKGRCMTKIVFSVYMAVFSFSVPMLWHQGLKELGTMCTWMKLRELLNVWEFSKLIYILKVIKLAFFASLLRWFRLLKSSDVFNWPDKLNSWSKLKCDHYICFKTSDFLDSILTTAVFLHYT